MPGPTIAEQAALAEARNATPVANAAIARIRAVRESAAALRSQCRVTPLRPSPATERRSARRTALFERISSQRRALEGIVAPLARAAPSPLAAPGAQAPSPGPSPTSLNVSAPSCDEEDACLTAHDRRAFAQVVHRVWGELFAADGARAHPLLSVDAVNVLIDAAACAVAQQLGRQERAVRTAAVLDLGSPPSKAVVRVEHASPPRVDPVAEADEADDVRAAWAAETIVLRRSSIDRDADVECLSLARASALSGVSTAMLRRHLRATLCDAGLPVHTAVRASSVARSRERADDDDDAENDDDDAAVLGRFVATLRGARQTAFARDAGIHVAHGAPSVRLAPPSTLELCVPRPGERAAERRRRLAEEGVSCVRGAFAAWSPVPEYTE